MNRKARVYFRGAPAGILAETPDGFSFTYDADFRTKNPPISASLPFSAVPLSSARLFPFFAGLLPEGWYLNVVTARYKIDRRDAFGLLLAVGRDTIGAVTIEELQ
ncbi:MAG: HipA N-terminal domain-containing protein [Candidatus Margulisbacteria bacterium]|jgi:serine/threonine-protein kinase HipA|nr:HipA N-terminal domain-containing protein [Candidatus Margulisiibacteriota bacterium]